jgi:ribosomal protein S6
MKTYELTYIISPEASSEQAEAKAKEIESIINSNQGVIIKQTNPTAKTFSYPISKTASGFFGVIELQTEPEKIQELGTILSKDTKIIRHILTIKKVEKAKKIRRSKTNAFVITPEQKTEKEDKEKPAVNESKPKVELKDIEQTLNQILSE